VSVSVRVCVCIPGPHKKQVTATQVRVAASELATNNAVTTSSFFFKSVCFCFSGEGGNELKKMATSIKTTFCLPSSSWASGLCACVCAYASVWVSVRRVCVRVRALAKSKESADVCVCGGGATFPAAKRARTCYI
jgi:hypothetical protein